MHPAVAGHVSNDLTHSDSLGICQSERQHVFESAGELTTVLKGYSAAPFPLQGVGAAMKDVNEEQLLEGESCPPPRPLGNRRWSMYHPDGVAQSGEPGSPQHVFWQILREQREQGAEMTVDDSANHLERQALGRRIDGEHLPGLYLILVLAELDVLARLK